MPRVNSIGQYDSGNYGLLSALQDTPSGAALAKQLAFEPFQQRPLETEAFAQQMAQPPPPPQAAGLSPVSGYSGDEMSAMGKVLEMFPGGMPEYNRWWSVQDRKPSNWTTALQALNPQGFAADPLEELPLEPLASGGKGPGWGEANASRLLDSSSMGSSGEDSGPRMPDVPTEGFEEGFEFEDVLETDEDRRWRMNPQAMSDADAFAEGFTGPDLEYDKQEHAANFYGYNAPPELFGKAKDESGEYMLAEPEPFLDTRGQPPFSPMYSQQELGAEFNLDPNLSYPVRPPPPPGPVGPEGKSFDEWGAGVLQKDAAYQTAHPPGIGRQEALQRAGAYLEEHGGPLAQGSFVGAEGQPIRDMGDLSGPSPGALSGEEVARAAQSTLSARAVAKQQAQKSLKDRIDKINKN